MVSIGKEYDVPRLRPFGIGTQNLAFQPIQLIEIKLESHQLQEKLLYILELKLWEL